MPIKLSRPEPPEHGFSERSLGDTSARCLSPKLWDSVPQTTTLLLTGEGLRGKLKHLQTQTRTVAPKCRSLSEEFCNALKINPNVEQNLSPVALDSDTNVSLEGILGQSFQLSFYCLRPTHLQTGINLFDCYSEPNNAVPCDLFPESVVSFHPSGKMTKKASHVRE